MPWWDRTVLALVTIAVGTFVPRAPSYGASGPYGDNGPVTLTPPRILHVAPFAVEPGIGLEPYGEHTYAFGLRPPPTLPDKTATSPYRLEPLSSLPRATDLSLDDPPVGDQGALSSCASWAIGYTLRGWYAKHDGEAGTPFAPMYLYTQLDSGHPDTSSSLADNLRLLQQQGISPRSRYPQGNRDYRDPPTASERAAAAPFRIAGYTQIFGRGIDHQDVIEQAMMTGNPVVLGMIVTSNVERASALDPFIDTPEPGDLYAGRHSVVAVAYDANGVWIQNQWSTTWGLKGYAELSWNFVNSESVDVAYVARPLSSLHSLMPSPSPRPS